VLEVGDHRAQTLLESLGRVIARVEATIGIRQIGMFRLVQPLRCLRAASSQRDTDHQAHRPSWTLKSGRATSGPPVIVERSPDDFEKGEVYA